jgi:hypothetical protein
MSNEVPRVVCLRRKQGKVVQDCDVYIGRECRKGGWDLPTSKWANPYSLYRYQSRELVLDKYEEHVRSHADLLAALPELAGQRLGCWCRPLPCHGDVIVKLFREVVLVPASTESVAAVSSAQINVLWW